MFKSIIKQTTYFNATVSIAIVLILSVIFISYIQANSFLTQNDWVIHTYKVIGTADSVLSDILDAESLTRGFLITGDDKFLLTFDDKVSKTLSDYSMLKDLTSDNKIQQQKINLLGTMLTDKINTMKAANENKKHYKIQNIEGNNLVYHGQDLSIQIKAEIKNIYDEEVRLLQEREESTLHAFNNMIYLTCLIAIVSIILLIALIIIINLTFNRLGRSNIRLENQANEIQLINEMNNLLSSCQSIDESIQIMFNYLKNLLPFSAGVIYLLKASGNYLESVLEWNDPKLHNKVFAPDQCWALRQGKTHVHLAHADTIICKHNEETIDSPSYLCVPLIAHNEIIGVLYLEIIQKEKQSKSQIKRIIKHAQLLIQNLAGQIGLSISNIKLHDILKTRSTRDPLTNLYNRSYLNESLERDIQRAKRKNISIAAVMIDLDLFKQINDTYGHEAGDEVLAQTASIILDNIRQEDVACRYGGEEFLLVLYDTDLTAAKARIEELRELIAQNRINFNGTKISITASFGIAMYPEHINDNAENLIKAADSALYNAKHNGRNNTVVYTI